MSTQSPPTDLALPSTLPAPRRATLAARLLAGGCWLPVNYNLVFARWETRPRRHYSWLLTSVMLLVLLLFAFLIGPFVV